MIFWYILIGYAVAVGVAISYNSYNISLGYTGIPWKQCFNPLKMLSFVLGWGISIVPKHIIDQYVIRLYSKDCRQCFKEGECFNEENENCGCPPYQKACSPFEACMGHWDPIIWSKKKWEKKILDNPFDLTINF